LQLRIDHIQDKAGLARLFQLQDDIADFEQRAGLHPLNVEAFDGQVLASRARLQRKALGNQVAHDLDVENADCTIRAVMLGMSVGVAFDAGFGHDAHVQRALRHTSVGNANRNDTGFDGVF
jgi:hypothetical protein